MKKTIKVKDIDISIITNSGEEYVSLTDIARKFSKRPNEVIKNYLRNTANISYLTEWETIYNPNFKAVNIHRFKLESTKNAFILSVKEWVKGTGAIGIYSVAGRYGGTYAHKDIAYQFAMWLSPVFYLYVVKEFDRLKKKEIEELQKEKEQLEKSQQFYLNKIFNSTLEANQLSKFLMDGQKLDKE